ARLQLESGLDPLGIRPPDVGEGEGRGVEVDQIVEAVGEVRHAGGQDAAEERAVEAQVPALAGFGTESGVAGLGEEQLIEARPPEAGAQTAVETPGSPGPEIAGGDSIGGLGVEAGIPVVPCSGG